MPHDGPCGDPCGTSHCVLASAIGDGASRCVQTAAESGRMSAMEHVGLANNVCNTGLSGVCATTDASRHSSSEHVGLAETVCDNGRMSSHEHTDLGGRVEGTRADLACKIAGAAQQSSCETAEIRADVAESAGDTQGSVRDAHVFAAQGFADGRSSLAERFADLTSKSVANADRVIDALSGVGSAATAAATTHGLRNADKLGDLAVQAAENHRRDLVNQKETQLEFLRLKCELEQRLERESRKIRFQAEQNKSELKFQALDDRAKLELQAQKNTCDIQRDLAACCCEIKEKLASCCCEQKALTIAEAAATRESISQQELSRIRDQLRDCQQTGLVQQIVAALVGGGIVPRPPAN